MSLFFSSEYCSVSELVGSTVPSSKSFWSSAHFSNVSCRALCIPLSGTRTHKTLYTTAELTILYTHPIWNRCFAPIGTSCPKEVLNPGIGGMAPTRKAILRSKFNQDQRCTLMVGSHTYHALQLTPLTYQYWLWLEPAYIEGTCRLPRRQK